MRVWYGGKQCRNRICTPIKAQKTTGAMPCRAGGGGGGCGTLIPNRVLHTATSICRPMGAAMSKERSSKRTRACARMHSIRQTNISVAEILRTTMSQELRAVQCYIKGYRAYMVAFVRKRFHRGDLDANRGCGGTERIIGAEQQHNAYRRPILAVTLAPD